MRFVEIFFRVPPAHKGALKLLYARADPEALESSADDRVGRRGNHSRPNFRSPRKVRLPAQGMCDASFAAEKKSEPPRKNDRQTEHMHSGGLVSDRTQT